MSALIISSITVAPRNPVMNQDPHYARPYTNRTKASPCSTELLGQWALPVITPQTAFSFCLCTCSPLQQPSSHLLEPILILRVDAGSGNERTKKNNRWKHREWQRQQNCFLARDSDGIRNNSPLGCWVFFHHPPRLSSSPCFC